MLKTTKYGRGQVAEHKSWTNDKNKRNVWCIYKEQVIDMTTFIEEHPGGEEVLLDHAGGDITQAFNDIGHSDYAKQLLTQFQVGVVDEAAGPAPTEQKKPAAKVASTATEKKPAATNASESSPRTTLLIPIGIILISILIYVYMGK